MPLLWHSNILILNTAYRVIIFSDVFSNYGKLFHNFRWILILHHWSLSNEGNFYSCTLSKQLLDPFLKNIHYIQFKSRIDASQSFSWVGKKTLFYFNETFSSTYFFIAAQSHLEMVECKKNVYFAISRQFLNVKTEYISITWHTFKQVNNSVWVTAFVVLAPVPHVHRLLNYQGIWSTSSLFVPTHFRASVIHPATTNVITLQKHKERAVMCNGLFAVVTYRPCFICFLMWLRDLLSYSAHHEVHCVGVIEHWTVTGYMIAYSVF